MTSQCGARARHGTKAGLSVAVDSALDPFELMKWSVSRLDDLARQCEDAQAIGDHERATALKMRMRTIRRFAVRSADRFVATLTTVPQAPLVSLNRRTCTAPRRPRRARARGHRSRRSPSSRSCARSGSSGDDGPGGSSDGDEGPRALTRLAGVVA